MWTRTLAVVAVLLAVAQGGDGAVALPVPSGSPPPPDAVQQAFSQAVCRVTVLNAWGIPQGLATGFLLGDGRFAVTDLAVAAQPGAAKVVLRFADKSEVAAQQFGMADPAVGLVALRIEGDGAGRTGLALASGLPALDGSVPVTTAGWRWGSQLDQSGGRLCKGPTISEVAARARIETPAGIDHFVRMDGRRLEGADGSPLLDSTGTVLAVVLDVVVRESAPLGMPSFSLRSALMSAAPQLRPLAELPKPLWPTQFLRLAGPVPSPAEFSSALQAVRKAMRCPRCAGIGSIVVYDAPGGGGGGGGRGGGGFGGGGWGGGLATRRACPVCRGEKHFVQEDLPAQVAEAVELGTRALWMPGAEERLRIGVRADSLALLKALVEVGPHFQNAFAGAMAADLGRRTGPLGQRGTVLRAQVQEHASGPDGAYVLLAPWQSSTLVAARVKDLTELGSKAALRDHKDPVDGTWVVVAGTVLSPFNSGARHGVYLLPLEWGPCAAPPPPPPRDERPPRGPPGGG